MRLTAKQRAILRRDYSPEQTTREDLRLWGPEPHQLRTKQEFEQYLKETFAKPSSLRRWLLPV